jgi:hypothetical protein
MSRLLPAVGTADHFLWLWLVQQRHDGAAIAPQSTVRQVPSGCRHAVPQAGVGWPSMMIVV